MNYLILTPDGVGSTYLQRALTVYLNCLDENYFNTHELLNGLELYNGNLIKNLDLGYSQSIKDICKLIQDNNAALISRIAQYHVVNRLDEQVEDYKPLYDLCNDYFQTVLYCVRNPFEYALSWAIRQQTGALNVYSINERIQTHSEQQHRTIDLDFFVKKLNQYRDYDYWVSDNFHSVQSVNYDQLHSNIDSLLDQITGYSDVVSQRFGATLQDYSVARYTVSKYKQNKHQQVQLDSDMVRGVLEIDQFIKQLIEQKKLPNNQGIPVKMNTMKDKRKMIQNFDHALDVFNSWADATNQYNTVTVEDIANTIQSENTIYADY